jgi:hypothetical protein
MMKALRVLNNYLPTTNSAGVSLAGLPSAIFLWARFLEKNRPIFLGGGDLKLDEQRIIARFSGKLRDLPAYLERLGAGTAATSADGAARLSTTGALKRDGLVAYVFSENRKGA